MFQTCSVDTTASQVALHTAVVFYLFHVVQPNTTNILVAFPTKLFCHILLCVYPQLQCVSTVRVRV